jgi:molecular chaperone DnaK
VPQVEVSFDIDANGIVHVSATDKASGKEQKITITSSSGLTQAEIDRMVQEAKLNEAADKAEREKVEKRNHLDGLILQVEKTLEENKEKIDANETQKVQDAITKAKVALKEHADNVAELQKATDELVQASHKVAEMLYQQQSGQPGEQSSEDKKDDENKPSDQGPIDADIS